MRRSQRDQDIDSSDADEEVSVSRPKKSSDARIIMPRKVSKAAAELGER